MISLSDKYGDWILYKPNLTLKTFTLVFPYIVLIAGGFIIVFLIKKRSKKCKLPTVLISHLVVFLNEI